MKQMYEAPLVQVIDMEVQASMMQASPGATMDATYSEEEM